MQLENRSRNARGHRSEKRLFEDVCLAFAGHDHHNPPRLHDAADAHRVGEMRHIRFRRKKTLVRLNGGIRQRNAVCVLLEHVLRLVEADVPIWPKPQQLEINAAKLADGRVVMAALRVAVLGHAIRNVRVPQVNLDMVEEILPHEMRIALRMAGGQPDIFIQIYRRYLPEINIALMLPRDELLIRANRAGAGCQSKNGIGFQNHLRRKNVRRLSAEMLVIPCANDLHIAACLSANGDKSPLYSIA